MRQSLLRAALPLLALAFALLAGGARAAQMEVRAAANGSWIYIRGELELNDGASFQRLLANTPNAAVVVLDSQGGRLRPGLEIGTAIRSRQLSTVVEDGALCASSCAVAWLGGSRRFMGATGRIGFHAAYRGEPGQVRTESGVGNALLGAYLNRLGLPDRAIAYITVAKPNQILWLSLADARALDIEASPFTTYAADQIAAAPAAASGGVDRLSVAAMERTAYQYPAWFFTQSAERPALVLDFLRNAYADELSLNGRPVTRDRALAIKHAFMEHWPEQAYKVRQDSLEVKCQYFTNVCDVSGIVDWEWSSWGRGARASGASKFWFTVAFEQGNPVLRSEAQTVFERQGTGRQ